MASYQRAKNIAAAPIGAGILISSSIFGEKASARSINHFSSAAIKNLNRAPCNIFVQRNQAFPRLNDVSNSRYRHKATAAMKSAPLEQSAQTKQTSPTLMQWYESHLKKNPVPTKMATGSFLWGVGDAVAQVVPKIVPGNNTDSIADSESNFSYDYNRTGRAVLFGFAIHAPLSHLHFNFLEWMTVKGGFTGMSIPVFKTVMEQFVYWSWVSNSLYHASMGAMQGMTANQISDRISDVLWDTQVAQWAFWIPVQLVNFRYVPVRHQLNVVLIVSVAWTALLSAWYPPEEEEESNEDMGSLVDANGDGAKK